jgi:hypothetical protein
MSTQPFVNLSVKDLAASTAFFTALDSTVDPRFSDENMTALSVNDQAYVLLHTEPYFSTFTDTSKYIESILTVGRYQPLGR